MCTDRRKAWICFCGRPNGWRCALPRTAQSVEDGLCSPESCGNAQCPPGPDHCRSRQLRFGGGSDASRISAHGGLFHCFCRRASLLPDAWASLESGKAAASSAGFCFCIRAYPSSGSAEGKVRADSIQSRLHIASERRKSSVVRLLQRSCSPDSESGKRGRNGESFSLKTENGTGRDHPPVNGG